MKTYLKQKCNDELMFYSHYASLPENILILFCPLMMKVCVEFLTTSSTMDSQLLVPSLVILCMHTRLRSIFPQPVLCHSADRQFGGNMPRSLEIANKEKEEEASINGC